MVAAIGLAGWFLASPGSYLAAGTEWTTTASGSILSTLAVIEPDDTATHTAPDTATYTPADFVGPTDQRGASPVCGQVVRRATDRMYRTLAYEPWAVMQFGSQEAADRWAHRYLIASTITLDEVAAVRAGETTIQDLSDQRSPL